jgi:MFS superfamily sulfate permease-like transporter
VGFCPGQCLNAPRKPFRSEIIEPTSAPDGGSLQDKLGVTVPFLQRFSILQGILPITKQRVPLEVAAGATLAAVAIPEVMGYTSIAGMPVVTGLYTLLLPVVAFALLGSSRHLVIGADSATAAILFAGLVGLKAVPESPKYVALAGMCAIIAGAMMLATRLARLSFLANFLSRSVLIGFLTGVGVLVATRQLAGMLGVSDKTRVLFGSGAVERLVATLRHLPEANIPSILFSLGVVGIILAGRKINRNIPAALISVIGAIVISWSIGPVAGLPLVGHIPRGIPHLGVPAYGSVFWVDNASKVIPLCFSLFLVMLTQSAATSRAYAAKYDEDQDEGSDILALGLANVSAGLTGTFPVNGSPTKTEIVDAAGSRSQLAQLTMAAFAVAVLVFLTAPLAKLPKAVLDSIVFLIGIQLIDITGMRDILHARTVEFWVAAVTAVVVVLIGVEQAIVLAILLSLAEYIRHGYKTKNAVLKYVPSGALEPMPVNSNVQALPGLIIYRFNTAVYFANADFFSEEALGVATQTAKVPVKWFCFAGHAIYDVDYTAGATLIQVCKTLQSRGIKVVFANIEGPVLSELARSGVSDLVGADAFYPTAHDVLVAYEKTEKFPDPFVHSQ